MLKIKKDNWIKYRFDEIAQNISERVEPAETDLDIYVGLEHLDSGSVHIKRHGHPSDVKGTKLKVYKGDVIFGKRRAYQRKAAVADFNGICSAHSMVLRAISNVILPELFPYFLHSDIFMNKAVDISEGSLSPTIKWNTLARQFFLIPPIDQQIKLLNLINSIDRLENGLEILIFDKKNHRNALMNEIFTKGVGHKKFKQTKFGEIPNSWSIKKLGEIGEFKTSSVDKKIKQDEEKVFLLNYMDVYKNYFIDKSLKLMEVTAKEKQISNNDVRKGDIFFTPSSETPDDIGHSAVIMDDLENTVYSYHLMRLRLESDFDLKFRGYFCNTNLVLKQFSKLSKGVTRFTLSKEDFMRVEVILPNDSDEQKEIANIIYEFDKDLEDTIHQLNLTQKLRLILLNKIF
jgi:restriction endonuclease S subunit